MTQYNVRHSEGDSGIPTYHLVIAGDPDMGFHEHLSRVVDHLLIHLDVVESKVHDGIDKEFKEKAPRLARYFKLVNSKNHASRNL